MRIYKSIIRFGLNVETSPGGIRKNFRKTRTVYEQNRKNIPDGLFILIIYQENKEGDCISYEINLNSLSNQHLSAESADTELADQFQEAFASCHVTPRKITNCFFFLLLYHYLYLFFSLIDKIQ